MIVFEQRFGGLQFSKSGKITGHGLIVSCDVVCDACQRVSLRE